MQYRLRSLMVVALVGPPLLSGAWFAWREFWREELEEVVAPYNIMPYDDVPPATPEEWAEAIDAHKNGKPFFDLPNSQTPAPNSPKD